MLTNKMITGLQIDICGSSSSLGFDGGLLKAGDHNYSDGCKHRGHKNWLVILFAYKSIYLFFKCVFVYLHQATNS